jgi:membrane associated rhomboid family serine protease
MLIVVNSAVFIYELTLGTTCGETFLAAFALIPKRLFYPDTVTGGTIPAAATLFTSMFLHGGLIHIAGNMLYLWIFGNNVEDATGRVRFFFFYMLCGLFAAFVHAFMNRSSLLPMLGASGAISGVLGAYMLLYPRARVVTLVMFGFFIRTVEVPAVIVLGLWFVLQFLNVLISSDSGGGVAWHAHIAGFAAGILLIGLFKRRDVSFGGGRGVRYP